MLSDDEMRKRVEQLEGREREVIERALANASLMEQMHKSLAAVLRGEKGVPGEIVRAEARARDAGL